MSIETLVLVFYIGSIAYYIGYNDAATALDQE